MGDWIKLYPKMTEWRWYTDTYAKCLFLHLLLTANYKDKPFLNTMVKRGQVLTSIRHLSEDLNIPEKTIRRKLDNLKSTGEVVTESTNKWTIITVCNYESYQASSKTDDQTNDQTNDQTDDQQLKNNRIFKKETISKDIVKKEDRSSYPRAPKPSPQPLSLESRQKSFYDTLVPYLGQYGGEMLRDFYNYWSEPDRSTTPRMRFEKEPTWDTARRLARWSKNNSSFGRRSGPKSKDEKMWEQVEKNLSKLPFNEDGSINL